MGAALCMARNIDTEGDQTNKEKKEKRYDIDIQSSESVVMMAGLNKEDRERERENRRGCFDKNEWKAVEGWRN